jgi:hypothetical protein
LDLGGGIKDLHVSNSGQIWCSYFDEGIYSRGGFGEGLIAFDLEGRVTFRFSELHNLDIPPIDDCYALNVDGDNVWTYYYSAFPLVKLERARLAQWWTSIPVRGAAALGIRGNEVLFVGSYEERNTIHRVTLPTMNVVSMTPVTADEMPIRPRQAFGRGNRLVLMTDDALFAAG